MKTREQKWESCKCCKQRTKVISQEAYSCDQCGKEIDMNKKNIKYLEAVIFTHAENTESESRQFCSWKCCIKNLRKVKKDYFISLPFLHYEKQGKGLHARDFFKLMK